MQKKTAIELFCGVGGTSIGFHQAGFDIRVGLDIDPIALESFALNHPEATALCKPVESVSGKELLAAAGVDRLDVLIGGPSCQGYSTIGKRLSDDPRNAQFKHYLRIVREIKPTWIMFENVRGMLISARGRFFEELSNELAALGYTISAAIMNAADYGVPQRRERVILIGTRQSDISVSLPTPTHIDPRCSICSKPDSSNRLRSKIAANDCPKCHGSGLEPIIAGFRRWRTLGDAISDLPLLKDLGGSDEEVPYSVPASSEYQEAMRESSTGVDLHRARPLSDYARSIVEKVPPGSGIRSIPEEQLPPRFKAMRKISNGKLRRDCTTLYYRLAWDMPSYTITCYSNNVSSGAFTHPEVSRAITAREAARLQSFPDRFKFVRRHVRRQIGNAVPPMLAKRIAEHMLDLERDEVEGALGYAAGGQLALQRRLL